jgi:prevent-host-death family protein
MKGIEVTKLRRNLASVLEGVARAGQPIQVRKHGRPLVTVHPIGNDDKPVIDKKAIAAFCRRHKIGRFSLFGSILGDDFGPESDIDVLIDLRDPSAGMYQLIEMERELEALFGRRVDLLTERGVRGSSNRLRRNEILSTAKLIHVS